MPVFEADDADIDDLAERCRSVDAGIRRVAMMELAESIEPEAPLLLVAGLRDSDPIVRAAAAKALDEHDGQEIVEALIAALEDGDAAVRNTVAETLAGKKEPASGPLLIERTQHPDPFVQAAALRALRELVLPDALSAALLALQSPHATVRLEGLGVIGWLKADSAIPALIATGNDSEPSVRRATMAALVFIAPGGPGSATLLSGLADENWQVREEAAISAGKIKLTEAIDVLIAAMNDEIWQVRIKAATALGKLKATKAIPALGANLIADISNLRKEVASALGEIGAVDALPYLEMASGDPDPDVRKLVRWAIGKCQLKARDQAGSV